MGTKRVRGRKPSKRGSSSRRLEGRRAGKPSKKAKRQCTSCGRTETSKWYGGPSSPIKCRICWYRDHREAVKAAHPGRMCSSCGTTETYLWYGVKSGPFKCQACYQKAREEAIQARPGIKCSSCGKTETSKWRGVKSGPIRCQACYQKSYIEAVKAANPGLKCSSCGETKTSQWYGVKSGPIKCQACYEKARRETVREPPPDDPPVSDGDTEVPIWLRKYEGELLFLPASPGLAPAAPLECSVCGGRYMCMPFDLTTNKATCVTCSDRRDAQDRRRKQKGVQGGARDGNGASTSGGSSGGQ